MKKVLKTKKTNDGMEIIERLFLRNDPELRKMVDEQFEQFLIGQQIYDLRQEAGLTQEQLAKLIGTTGSAISRLEDADYNGHSLKMLVRITAALGKKIDLRIVDRKSKLRTA